MAKDAVIERSEREPRSRAAGSAADPAREAWQLLGRLFLGQRGRTLALAAELGLSPPQLFALRLLDRPLPMGELASALRCDSSNVTGIVDRLEQRGLVERRGAPHDRRVKLLVLTKEGEGVRRELSARLDEPAEAIARLSRADQRALRDILRRALDDE